AGHVVQGARLLAGAAAAVGAGSDHGQGDGRHDRPPPV
ncbi:MAG: hypothetical protein AVDCRST_MAG12-1509, partial [uncultured Rubrobacteraceae bacterium]